MDKSDKSRLKIPLLRPETAKRLSELSPGQQEKVLEVASKLLARYLKRRSQEIRYPVEEERITVTNTGTGPDKLGTWTPLPPYKIED